MIFEAECLYGERFQFVDEKSGRTVKMGRIFYTDGDLVSDNNRVGLAIKVVTCDYEVLDDIRQLIPGKVKLRFKFVPVKNQTKVHVIGVG